ncbi:hypothetical protein CSC94_13180 [Zhengella mangrovi]|uniref:Uncharacterized protein n=1 Tax=Zhengella mangrovi TaxID=1982044 RepID=A0A2G1QME2_9HYPH|nr:hypothetical protein [Zhengella mangrovi]PHP66630.1 hypothetical protein CSC94_13180 [Zhengella mangrovi]
MANILTDIISETIDGALKEILKKPRRTTRRRRRSSGVTGTIVSELEKMLAPAKKQTSRKATARRRSKTTQRKTRAKTATRRRTKR